jgi:molybdenum cofactor synthesis domain-containing protein
MSRIDESKPFIPVRIAVLTVSDTRDQSQDRSGDVLVERLEKAGHILADRTIIRDERDEISAQLKAWIARDDVDVVISTGGTGLTGRDVTVEAHRDVYEKGNRRLRHRLHRDFHAEDRHIGGAIAGHGGRGGGHIPLCPARQPGRLQGCVGRNPRPPARLPAPALQFRADHAAAR